jgi:hypothetical protein
MFLGFAALPRHPKIYSYDPHSRVLGDLLIFLNELLIDRA